MTNNLKVTGKEFNKNEFEREMKKELSKKDIMIKGKRVDFETSIKGNELSELIYGNKIQKTPNPIYNKEIKEGQERYLEVWENYKRYN